MKKGALISLAALVVCLVGAGLLTWWHFRTANSPLSQSVQTNPDFRQGSQALNSGNYREAVSAFGRALGETQDPAQKEIALYALAVATAPSNSMAAIPMLEQVAADPAASALTRAYAVQELGQIAYGSSFLPSHASIMAEVFKDEPYKDMLVSGDEPLTIRHLFEYATSFYPLALSELRIVDWYMKTVLFDGLSTTTAPGSTYVSVANQKIQSADLDIQRTINLPTRTMIPEALSTEALVGGELAQAGVVSAYGAAQAYQQALDSYKTYDPLPGQDSAARFNYAGFLAGVWGASRETDIHSIVSPLYLDPADYRSSSMLKNLSALASMTSSDSPKTTSESIKLRARQIAAVDAGFRNLLMSLGWNASDFANVPRSMTN